ncbi:MAG: VTT domain-containing protein [Sphaerochaetaceae bacterium]|jgi:uncharacterized membrane protein YdjX (TVP38/TMEM64 family)|nr:VTT domain-containing protein [Sphaerochaetaceae bacterium]
MNSGKRRKIVAIISMTVFIGAMASAAVLWGPKMVQLVKEPQAFSQWVQETGWRSRIVFVLMVIAQVIVAVIPGEPFEIAAGYAFGILEGTILCLLGTFLGGMLVFLLTRKLGMKFVEVFFDPEQISKLKWLKDDKKLSVIVFWLFFIPGTPKDVLTYFVGLTPLKIRQWLLISLSARLPSIVSSAIGGHFLGQSKWELSVLAFAITGILALGGMLFYKAYTKRQGK